MKRKYDGKSTVSRKKRRKSSYTKKKSWVRRGGYESVPPIFPGRSVFPFYRWTTLKYVESYVAVDPPIGGASAFIMRANDLYDPNLTGTGHQPTGFDQYMTMYNRFVVYSSKVKVICYSSDSETVDTVVGVTVADNSTTQSVVENYMEQPLTDWKVVPAGAGAHPVTVYTAFNARAFSGTDPRTNDLLHGATAPPSKLWYYHCFCAATGAAENPISCKFSIEVEYRVKFFEPKSQTIS